MEKFDFIIIGAGLAGMAAAAHLIESDSSIKLLVYDATKVGDGASGLPAGMVNPVTGRNARLVWQAENSMRLLEKRLEILKAYSTTPLSANYGVFRPAIDEELGTHLKKALHQTKWPHGWKEWIADEEVNKRFPGLKKSSGGLLIKKGKVVLMPEYLKAFATYLKKNGVRFLLGGPHKLLREKTHWKLRIKDYTCSAPAVIVATGYKTRENKFWKDIPLHSVKGQLALYHSSKPVIGHPAVSAYGYIAPVSDKKIVVGSTYEHLFHDEKPDDQAAALLDQKLRELMPGWYESCTRTELWSGVRANTPDRLPIIGEHPLYAGLMVYTGLGSKGLLYSEYGAARIADCLISSKKLPGELSINRFTAYQLSEDEAE